MPEDNSPIPLSPYLKETSSVYSDTPAEWPVSSKGEDTMDRMLEEKGLPMTPILQNETLSSSKSFADGSHMNEIFDRRVGPSGVNNKRSFRHLGNKRTNIQDPRLSLAFEGEEVNSSSETSSVISDLSGCKQSVRQTNTFRTKKSVPATEVTFDKTSDSSITLSSGNANKKRRPVSSFHPIKSRNTQAKINASFGEDEAESFSSQSCSQNGKRSARYTEFRHKKRGADAPSQNNSFQSSCSQSSANLSQETSAPKRFKKAANTVKGGGPQETHDTPSFEGVFSPNTSATHAIKNKTEKASGKDETFHETETVANASRSRKLEKESTPPRRSSRLSATQADCSFHQPLHPEDGNDEDYTPKAISHTDPKMQSSKSSVESLSLSRSSRLSHQRDRAQELVPKSLSRSSPQTLNPRNSTNAGPESETTDTLEPECEASHSEINHGSESMTPKAGESDERSSKINDSVNSLWEKSDVLQSSSSSSSTRSRCKKVSKSASQLGSQSTKSIPPPLAENPDISSNLHQNSVKAPESVERKSSAAQSEIENEHGSNSSCSGESLCIGLEDTENLNYSPEECNESHSSTRSSRLKIRKEGNSASKVGPQSVLDVHPGLAKKLSNSINAGHSKKSAVPPSPEEFQASYLEGNNRTMSNVSRSSELVDEMNNRAGSMKEKRNSSSSRSSRNKGDNCASKSTPLSRSNSSEAGDKMEMSVNVNPKFTNVSEKVLDETYAVKSGRNVCKASEVSLNISKQSKLDGTNNTSSQSLESRESTLVSNRHSPKGQIGGTSIRESQGAGNESFTVSYNANDSLNGTHSLRQRKTGNSVIESRKSDNEVKQSHDKNVTSPKLLTEISGAEASMGEPSEVIAQCSPSMMSDESSTMPGLQVYKDIRSGCTFNSENEVVLKAAPNCRNAEDASENDELNSEVESDDEDLSIFSNYVSNVSRTSNSHTGNLPDINGSLVNASLSSYSATKIVGPTEATRSFRKADKVSPATTSHPLDQVRLTRRKSTSYIDNSASALGSTGVAQDYSTVVNFSLNASNGFGGASYESADSDISRSDSRRLTCNMSQVMNVSKQVNTTVLDYEGSSHDLPHDSIKSSKDENMRLHITDDLPVFSVNHSVAEVTLSARGNSSKSNTEPGSKDHAARAQNTSQNPAKPRRSLRSRGSMSRSPRPRQGSVDLSKSAVDKSVEESGFDRDLSQSNADGDDNQSEADFDKSYEVADDSDRGSRKRKTSGRASCSTNSIGAQGQRRSRESVKENADPTLESTENGYMSDDVENAEDVRSANASVDGNVYNNGSDVAFFENEANYPRACLHNESDTTDDYEDLSSYNATGATGAAGATPGVKNASTRLSVGTDMNDFFAKPLYPVNRRLGQLRRSNSSANSSKSDNSLSLLSKCIKKKTKTRNSKRLSLHVMNLRKRGEDFPKYVTPKLNRPAYWVTNKLYQFLEEKLRPAYGILAKKQSEKFVNFLQEKCKKVLKQEDEESENQIIVTIKDEMVDLRIIKSDFMFYNFCFEFLPMELSNKIVPSFEPFTEKCSKSNFDKNNLFEKYF